MKKKNKKNQFNKRNEKFAKKLGNKLNSAGTR